MPYSERRSCGWPLTRVVSIAFALTCIALSLAMFVSSAHALQQTPSGLKPSCPTHYYSVHTTNALNGVNSDADYSLCVYIRSASTRIGTAVKLTVIPTNAAALHEALMAQLVPAGPCVVTQAGGWQILSFNLVFQRASEQSQIRISGKAKDCAGSFFDLTSVFVVPPGAEFTYEVPVTAAYTAGGLKLSLKGKPKVVLQPRRFFNDSASAKISAIVSDALQSALDKVALEARKYVPDFVNSFDLSINQVKLVVEEHQVALQVFAAGSLTKAEGEKLLFDLTRNVSADHLFQFNDLFGHAAGM
jgi:hypothetical protein